MKQRPRIYYSDTQKALSRPSLFVSNFNLCYATEVAPISWTINQELGFRRHPLPGQRLGSALALPSVFLSSNFIGYQELG